MSSKLSIMRHAYAVGVGTAAGITSGLVGWGGAQIIIPSMLYPSPLASYSQLSATGISLSSLSLSSISSGYRFWSDNQVNIPLALSIGLPAVVSARIGSHIAKKLSGNALELFFNGFSLLLIPTHLWIQKIRSERDALDAADVDKEEEDTISKTRIDGSTSSRHLLNETTSIQATSNSGITSITDAVRNNPLTLQHSSFGTFSGILSSLIGVGGLPLTMSYLTLSTDLPHHEVQGTAVVALIPAILMSAGSRISVIPKTTTACVAVGAFGGGLLGARVALDLSEEKLRYLFMGSLCLFGGINMAGAARNILKITKR